MSSKISAEKGTEMIQSKTQQIKRKIAHLSGHTQKTKHNDSNMIKYELTPKR